MTNSSYDEASFTRILQDKDHDLELAARIGQSLLETNQQMQTRVESLEQEVRSANERVAQLTHEVRIKSEMLKQYLRDEEAECERRFAEQAEATRKQNSAMSTPQRITADKPVGNQHSADSVSLSNSTGGLEYDWPAREIEMYTVNSNQEDLEAEGGRSSGLKMVASLNRTLDELQQRVASLEHENCSLRTQQSELRCGERVLVRTEQTLVTEVIRQLGDANAQIVSLTEDVTRKTDLCVKQQADNAGLISYNAELEDRVHRLLMEKEEAEKRLRESHAVQRELTTELSELRSRVSELAASLSEAQDEVRTLRRRKAVSTHGAVDMTMSRYSLNEHSLAAEINDCFFYHPSDVDREAVEPMSMSMCQSTYEFGLQHQQQGAALSTSTTLNGIHARRAAHASSSCTTASTSGVESMDDQATHNSNANDWLSESPSSSMTLESAQDRNSGVASRSGSQAQADQATVLDSNRSGSSLSHGGHEASSAFNSRRSCYSKVQIVKPLAGSLTLTWWQQLATPSLASVLQPKSGIKTKGNAQRSSTIDEDKLALSDVDEDDEADAADSRRRIHWKSADDTRCTFTYSTSRILHPTDVNVYELPQVSTQSRNASTVTTSTSMSTSVSMNTNTSTVFSSSSSSARSAVRVASSTSASSSAVVPRQPASTFSVTRGLAELLNERGMPQSGVLSRPDDGSAGQSQVLSQAVRLPALTVPSVMASSRSVTERIFALPSVAESQPTTTAVTGSTAGSTLESKAQNAAALQLGKLDYFGLFNFVKTVTNRVMEIGGATSAGVGVGVGVGREDSTCQEDTLKPLWKPAPGSLSDKTLRYVSSSPNLQNLAGRHLAVDGNKQALATNEQPLQADTAGASSCGLNLLAQAPASNDGLASPKVVLRSHVDSAKVNGSLISAVSAPRIATRAQL